MVILIWKKIHISYKDSTFLNVHIPIETKKQYHPFYSLFIAAIILKRHKMSLYLQLIMTVARVAPHALQ